MTTEITQITEDGEVKVETVSIDVPASDSAIIQDSSTTESAQDAWKSFQTKTSTFLDNAGEYTSAFFKNNQQLLINLGWLLLAVVGIKLLFTILGVVDNIPLISPILKLVGLIYVSWFVWRYLLRASSRQELGQIIDRTKSEWLGDRS